MLVISLEYLLAKVNEYQGLFQNSVRAYECAGQKATFVTSCLLFRAFTVIVEE